MTFILGALAIGLLVYAALHDLAVRTVPNWLPLCVLAIGCLARLADHSLIPALIVAAVTFGVLFVIWVLGYMGGGDVKLWAASALLVPPRFQSELLFFERVVLLGGLLGLIYLALWLLVRRWRASVALRTAPASLPRSFVARVLRAEVWRIGRRGPLPYACAISASAILSLVPASLSVLR